MSTLLTHSQGISATLALHFECYNATVLNKLMLNCALQINSPWQRSADAVVRLVQNSLCTSALTSRKDSTKPASPLHTPHNVFNNTSAIAADHLPRKSIFSKSSNVWDVQSS